MFYHEPIMLERILDILRVKEGKVYFDGTLGGGGHSLEILKAGGTVVATDLDGDAIQYASNRFKSEGFAGKFTLIRGNFKNACAYLDELGIEKIDGALLDLGVSSHQLDTPDRGFSYRYDAPLDMRMNLNQRLTAETVVNEYGEGELLKILYEYGEESHAKRIVREIVRERERRRIKTTGELVEIIERCIPHVRGSHPAKQTFQAIRIEVNGELDGLKEAVESITRKLNPGGRICVLTFHSLEDRIVKNAFRTMATDCLCDKSVPVCVCNHKAEIKIIKTEKKADSIELVTNPRSKSASLRAAEKI